MTDEQLIEKMKNLKFSEEEINQWNQILPGLEENEKEELNHMIDQFAQERNVLSARQLEEIRELKSKF